MTSVSVQADLEVPRELVWRVLMDFAHYSNWHPHVILDGVPIVGEKIDFSFRRKPGAPRALKTKAIVTKNHPPSMFAIKFHVPGLFTMEQWYSLEEIPGGTRVTHGSTYGGVWSIITGKFVRKRLLAVHQLALDRLALGFVKFKKPKPQQADKVAPKPRKGFRGYRR